MKERPPAFQFYPRQFTGDEKVMAMDREAIGAHILLMCIAAASSEGYRIEADEYAIRMCIRNPSDERWADIKRQLLKGAWKLSPDQKWWIQEGLQRTLEKQKAFGEQQSRKARTRWHPAAGPQEYRNDAGTCSETMPEDCSSSSSSSSNKNVEEQHGGGDVQRVRKSRQEVSETGLRLAQLLTSHILRNNPTSKITDSQISNWAREADRMLRIDHRTEEQIRELIEFSQRDRFWLANILSMSKLRQQFDRLTVLRKQKQQKEWGTEIDNSEESQSVAPRWAGLEDGSKDGSTKK